MENSKGRNYGLTLLAISFLQTLASSSMSPALGRIAGEFSGVSMPTIQMVMTIPSICIIIMSFLVVTLLNRYPLKHIMLAGICLYIVGGFGGITATGIYMLLAFRAVMGFGLGIIGPLLPIAVSGKYEQQSRAKMMGYLQSSNFLGGIAGTVLGGILAGFGWRNMFWLYLFGLPALALGFIFLSPAKKASEKENKAGPAPKVPFNGTAIFLGISMLFHALFFFKAPLNMAMYLPSIGVESTTASGIAVGILYFGSLLAGLFVVQIGKVLKNVKIPFVFLLEGLAYLLLWQTKSLPNVCLATGMLGFGNGIFVPSWFAMAPERLKGPLIPKTITLINTALYLGMFLTPYASQLVKSIGTNSIQFDFMVVAICEGIMAVVATLSMLRQKKSADIAME